jgi:hypothetical protein
LYTDNNKKKDAQGEIRGVWIRVSERFIAYDTNDASNEEKPAEAPKKVTETSPRLGESDISKRERDVHFPKAMFGRGRKGVLPLLSKPTLGLISIQTLGFIDPQSTRRFVSRNFVPF